MISYPNKIFITGIGTDVGKSYATGWLARTIAEDGFTVITQKFIQTGNHDMSEDIAIHRQIMGIPLQEVDLNHITAPIIFSYPASPDLAARIDNRPLDLSIATQATEKLHEQYQTVLIEGAGGIMVPLIGQYLTIDYIKENNLPVAVVTNGQLGSVSDTLLTLDAIRSRGIDLYALIYNPRFDKDTTIAADTRRYLQNYLTFHFPDARWIIMPDIL